MIRPLTLLSLIAAAGAGGYLYQVKHSVSLLDRTLRDVNRQTEQARERTQVLRAEWALLNEPDRLRQVAQRYLQLEPMTPAQFVRGAEMERRLPQAQAFAGPPSLFAPPASEAPEPAQPLGIAAAPPADARLAAAAPVATATPARPAQPEPRPAAAPPGSPVAPPRPAPRQAAEPAAEARMAAAPATAAPPVAPPPVAAPPVAAPPVAAPAAPRPAARPAPASVAPASVAAAEAAEPRSGAPARPAAALARAEPAARPAPPRPAAVPTVTPALHVAPRPEPAARTTHTDAIPAPQPVAQPVIASALGTGRTALAPPVPISAANAVR